jgi:glycerophosphoryl diester phosphodiesterase
MALSAFRAHDLAMPGRASMISDTSSVKGPRRLPRKSGFGYLDDLPPGGVIAMAHRGGALHPANVGLENTLVAFKQAASLGYHYLETDVHATRDGVVMAFHDDRLDRVTDQRGAITDLLYAELATARIGGLHPIPTLAELLEALPEARFNIDIKADNAVVPLVDLIEQTNSADRVLIGSFSLSRLRRFRRLTQRRVPTSAAPLEVSAFRLLPSGRLADLVTGKQVDALQVPLKHGRLTVVTPGFVRRAHAAGKHVHVWTVDEVEQMRTLLDLGVDGLISDRTDVLQQVLAKRGLTGAL